MVRYRCAPCGWDAWAEERLECSAGRDHDVTVAEIGPHDTAKLSRRAS